MAEISLREYLDKVDALLKTGKSDEVILHSRQILKQYPKNVAASRFLGQALVHGSDYKEAEPVLRRVLSVYPEDVMAHTGLSDMNDRQGKGEEAIWHIERALEGAPNDSGLIEKWRGLYQRYRKVEDPRFQLTTGAVARQYVRNNLYTQAIETLNTTLEKSPRRVDLRLLLAQTLWNAGMQVEGAETALDVLDVLPYCLEANRILTLLWLSEGRPSDAQRYLNHIQEVEPYQALQLAQNTPPDDEAFTVTELDYRRIAETQMNNEQPDWLTEIDDEAAPALTALDDQEFELDDELPQAFLTDIEADDAPVVTRPKTGMTGLLAALDQPQGLADDDEPELPVSDELPGWLLESAPSEALTENAQDVETEADPLAWLSDSGTELTDDSANTADTFSAAESSIPDWMSEPAAEDAAAPDFFADTDFGESEDEDHDPLAWLEGSGVELVEEDEMPPTSSLIDEEDMVYSDPENINPLAWLESSGVELVEENEDDTLHTPPAVPAEPEAADADALAWLEADSIELASEDPQAVPNTTDDALDWLAQADSAELPVSGLLGELPQASAPDDDGLGWLQDVSLGDTENQPTASVPDFFADMDRATDRLPGSAATLSDSEFTGTGGQNEMSDEKDFEPQSDDSELSSFEWLNAEPEIEDGPQANASDLDWMTEIPGEQPEWLNEENGEPEDAAPTTGGPDWLAEEPGAVTNEFGWLNETSDEAEPAGEMIESALDWLSSSADEEETAQPAEMPDWLSAAAPVSAAADEEQGEAEAFDWSEDEAEPVSETAPDWLSAIAPEADEEEPAAEAFNWSTEAEIVSEAAPDWLSGSAIEDDEPEEMISMSEWLADADAEPESEVEPIGEAPDWLSAAAPEAEDTIDSELEASLDALEMEAADDAESAAELAAMPDWLADAQPAAEDANVEAEPVADVEAFDWSVEEAEPVSDTETAPDWLSAIAPAAAEAEVEALEWEAEADVEPAAEIEAFDWSEEEAEPVSETAPDWLSAIAPAADEAEVESEIEAELAALEWEADEDEAEAISETPDWLSAAAPLPADALDSDLEPAAEAESFEWVDDEEEAEAIGETPDWLSAAAPLAADALDSDLEPAAEAESFEWVDDEEEAEAISETPDWLSAAAPLAEDDDVEFSPSGASAAQTRILPDQDFGWSGDEDEMEYEAEPVSEWLEEPDDEVVTSAEMAMMDEDELDFEEKVLAAANTPPPADNAPDWLNAMVPGLDLDYQAIEDDRPIESEYIESPARREQPETAQSGDFNWLVDIVDEETGPMRAIQDTPSRSRFKFSRQPAWLRDLLARRESTQSDDDFELPEWLR